MARRRARDSTLPAPDKPLERRTELRRSAWGSKKTPAQRRRDEERKAREFRRKYHSLERVYFVSQALMCAVPICQQYVGDENHNAHVRTGGTGRKADYTDVIPLCPEHHEEVHQGRETFVERRGINLELAAAQTERSWQIYGDDVVGAAKADGRFESWLERRRIDS